MVTFEKSTPVCTSLRGTHEVMTMPDPEYTKVPRRDVLEELADSDIPTAADAIVEAIDDS